MENCCHVVVSVWTIFAFPLELFGDDPILFAHSVDESIAGLEAIDTLLDSKTAKNIDILRSQMLKNRAKLCCTDRNYESQMSKNRAQMYCTDQNFESQMSEDCRTL